MPDSIARRLALSVHSQGLTSHASVGTEHPQPVKQATAVAMQMSNIPDGIAGKLALLHTARD